jgi:ferredoxin--NADP+ reductase
VIKVFEKTGERDGFSFFGNVHIGVDITVEELQQFYDAVVFSTGAESDRKLGINGEDLRGSHTATEFVGWYNGHPDYQDRQFDLSQEVAVIIGQGNVAMDVARILSKTVDELKNTDITQNALTHLADSKIREVHIFGRRGPMQAAFTPPEIKEFGELADCAPVINPSELNLNEASLKELEDPKCATYRKNFEILKALSQMNPEGKSRKLFIHFLKSPVELVGTGRVEKVIFEENELSGEPGQQKAKGTGKKVEAPCGLFFRSVGYKGVAIQGVPFDERAGVIPNQQGRVTESGEVVPGLYVSGWIKRGPSGVIGTNKPDSEETIKSLLEDVPHLMPCKQPSTQVVRDFLRQHKVRAVSFADWKKIDVSEMERGQTVGKPREKFLKVEGMLSVL